MAADWGDYSKSVLALGANLKTSGITGVDTGPINKSIETFVKNAIGEGIDSKTGNMGGAIGSLVDGITLAPKRKEILDDAYGMVTQNFQDKKNRANLSLNEIMGLQPTDEVKEQALTLGIPLEEANQNKIKELENNLEKERNELITKRASQVEYMEYLNKVDDLSDKKGLSLEEKKKVRSREHSALAYHGLSAEIDRNKQELDSVKLFKQQIDGGVQKLTGLDVNTPYGRNLINSMAFDKQTLNARELAHKYPAYLTLDAKNNENLDAKSTMLLNAIVDWKQAQYDADSYTGQLTAEQAHLLKVRAGTHDYDIMALNSLEDNLPGIRTKADVDKEFTEAFADQGKVRGSQSMGNVKMLEEQLNLTKRQLELQEKQLNGGTGQGKGAGQGSGGGTKKPKSAETQAANIGLEENKNTLPKLSKGFEYKKLDNGEIKIVPNKDNSQFNQFLSNSLNTLEVLKSKGRITNSQYNYYKALFIEGDYYKIQTALQEAESLANSNNKLGISNYFEDGVATLQKGPIEGIVESALDFHEGKGFVNSALNFGGILSNIIMAAPRTVVSGYNKGVDIVGGAINDIYNKDIYPENTSDRDVNSSLQRQHQLRVEGTTNENIIENFKSNFDDISKIIAQEQNKVNALNKNISEDIMPYSLTGNMANPNDSRTSNRIVKTSNGVVVRNYQNKIVNKPELNGLISSNNSDLTNNAIAVSHIRSTDVDNPTSMVEEFAYSIKKDPKVVSAVLVGGWRGLDKLAKDGIFDPQKSNTVDLSNEQIRTYIINNIKAELTRVGIETMPTEEEIQFIVSQELHNPNSNHIKASNLTIEDILNLDKLRHDFVDMQTATDEGLKIRR